MSIPDFQSIMLPLLKYHQDKQPMSIRDCIDVLSEEFKLTDDERKHMLSSGNQTTMQNRVYWASIYLRRAKLLDNPKRGFTVITQRGVNVLAENLSKINIGCPVKTH